MSTQKQKDAIKQFKNVTGCNDSVASEFLKKNIWKVDSAIDDYYHAESSKANPSAVSKANELFDGYAGKGEDTLTDIVKLAADLGVDPNDIILLAFAWKLKTKKLAEFSRSEWTHGIASVFRVHNLTALKKSLEKLREELNNDNALFREFYLWVFDITKASPEARVIPVDEALVLWEVVISGRFKLWPNWKEFMSRPENNKAISKDTWSVFFDFINTHNSSLTGYDVDGAWPSVIDNFVDWMSKQTK